MVIQHDIAIGHSSFGGFFGYTGTLHVLTHFRGDIGSHTHIFRHQIWRTHTHQIQFPKKLVSGTLYYSSCTNMVPSLCQISSPQILLKPRALKLRKPKLKSPGSVQRGFLSNGGLTALVKPSRHQTWLGNPRTKWWFIDGTIIELNVIFSLFFHYCYHYHDQQLQLLQFRCYISLYITI